MITKQLRITVAILAFAAMPLVAVSAGQVGPKADPQQKVRPVYLRCSMEKLARTEIVLNIFNSTTDTIPEGTKIYWLITQKVKGEFVLGEKVSPREFFKRGVKPTPPGTIFMFNPQPEPPVPLKVWFEQKVHSGAP